MQLQTIGALALSTTGNAQGNFHFLSLSTGRVISQTHATSLPMTDDMIGQVHPIAKWQSNNPGLLFTDKNEVEYQDDNDDDVSDYVPSNNDYDDDDNDDDGINYTPTEDDETDSTEDDHSTVNYDAEEDEPNEVVSEAEEHGNVGNGIDEPTDAEPPEARIPAVDSDNVVEIPAVELDDLDGGAELLDNENAGVEDQPDPASQEPVNQHDELCQG